MNKTDYVKKSNELLDLMSKDQNFKKLIDKLANT